MFPVMVSTNASVKTLLSITVSTNALLSIVVLQLKHSFLLVKSVSITVSNALLSKVVLQLKHCLLL